MRGGADEHGLHVFRQAIAASAEQRAGTRCAEQGQSGARADRELTAAVRKAIVRDKSLSTYAHNVKVVTRDGVVTLRGPVRTNDEKAKVAEIAQQVAGVSKVNDELLVKNRSKS